jgi:hypothetical protein
LTKATVYALALLLAAEDMWHAYNLIREGDSITATTFRKVTRDTGVGAESERVKIKLTIKVEAVEFDPEGKQQQQQRSLGAPILQGKYKQQVEQPAAFHILKASECLGIGPAHAFDP